MLLGFLAAPARPRAEEGKPLLVVTVRIDLSTTSSRDRGSLFEVYAADRQPVAGVAFVPDEGARADGNQARLRLFLSPPDAPDAPDHANTPDHTGTPKAAALTATLTHTDGPTTLRFRLMDGQASLHQDGKLLATSIDTSHDTLRAPPRRIVWGRGSHGTFRGELLARTSNLDRPFLGAYMHLPAVLRGRATDEERERAIDNALDGLRAAGLNVAMPYVTSTSGAAFYPSRIITEQPFGHWDPLAYVIDGAHARGLQVYPVICVLASGHGEPSGILRKHPEWALRTPDGQPMGHVSPAHPEAQHWLTSVIKEVVDRYPTTGVLLDYLRFYNRQTRLDAASEALLHEYQKEHSELSAAASEQHFRERSLTELASAISHSTRSGRPDLQIAIYSWGPHVASDHRVAQPWPLWSRAGLVDMINISGYCYPDNYGDRYLEVFSRRIGDAVALNRQHRGRADVTFCLGVATSHGRIENASWIGDYLTRAAAQGARGTAMFTWSSLVPYLDAVNEAGYLGEFSDALRTDGSKIESSSSNR